MSYGAGLGFVIEGTDIKVCDHKWKEEEWNPNWEYCVRCDDTRKKEELTPFGL